MDIQKKIAKALLEIHAVGFVLEKPIKFKSGIWSPVYVDNRTFPFHPAQWRQVITGFGQLITQESLSFDVIAGIESAGIPHSAALGFSLKRPSVFVRKAAKDHGTKKMVEGGSVAGKTVLLIEDHVTTGGSSLLGVKALRAEGATVQDCLAITNYEFPESEKEFHAAGVRLHTLTTFPIILAEAKRAKILTEEQVKIVKNWIADPWGWGKKHGLESL